MTTDVIFEPLVFPNLNVKNRIFRWSISGRFDNYDVSGNHARINWDAKFARGGVGAIISSFVPVHIRGRVSPGYALLNSNDEIAFRRKVGEKVREFDRKYIMQSSQSGRQRDIAGVENFMNKALSSTNRYDTFHGLLCEAATPEQIRELVGY